MSSPPDGFTFPLVIKACSQLGDPKLCSSIHTHVSVLGFNVHLHVANELVSMYANLGRMELARKVFDGMTVRTVVSWNVLVSGFAANFDCVGALVVFRLMEEVGPVPNSVTWTSLLSAHNRCRRHAEVVELFDEMRSKGVRGSAEMVAVALSVCAYLERDALETGKKMHGYVVRNGFERYPFVRNSLVCMYGKLGCREDAEIIFVETEEKSLESWNALISSYVVSGLCNEAYEVFSQMEKSGGVEPNVVSWSAIIGAFASARMAESSLQMFRRMQQAACIRPNSVTIATVLSSCAELSALNLGKEIHSHTIRSLMDQNILVGNGLLNMYTKSGSLSNGLLVFGRMKERDLISWNTMITGYGMHGYCDEALATFDDMIRTDVDPDGVTFVAVLSACSHAGRVSDGRQLFHRMVREFGVSPAMEHYSCMVDLLGRARLLREASNIVQGMPFRPNACVVGALLNSCRIHGNNAIAEECMARVMELEGETSGSYMLLSNIYAASGDWEESAKVRVMTKARGLRKQPGQSWIEVAKKVFVFSSGSSLPVGTEKAHGVMEELSEQMDMEREWLIVNTVEGEGEA